MKKIKLFLTLLLVLTTISCSLLQVEPKKPPSEYIRNTTNHSSPGKSIIVFVHGVAGDVNKTWKNSQADGSWPDIVKQDCQMDKFDIFSVSYYSPLLKQAPAIPELATKLIFELESNKILDNYDNIVFVGHSMGNLVVRHAIWNTRRFDNIINIFLVSLGAPSHGSSLANIAKLISDNPQFKNMVEIDYNAYLQTLYQMWQNDKKDIEIACAYEGKDYSGIGRIVTQGSATAICARHESIISITADHVDMVKPESVSDDIHKWLKLEVSKKRYINPSIVLMDSPALLYDQDAPAGKMNSHFIENKLKSKVTKPIINIPVHAKWKNYDKIRNCKTGLDPDVIIIHYSSFSDEIDSKDGKDSGARERGLKRFLDKVLKSTHKTKILVYSRWKEGVNANGIITTKNMKKFLDDNILNDVSDINKKRVYAFNANKYGKQPVTFKDEAILDKLEGYLFEILSVDTALSTCGSI